MDPELVSDLSRRFVHLMEERRQGNTQTPAESTQSPTVAPVAPQDELYRTVINLSRVPQRYEKPGLMDNALESLDLDKIFSWADEFATENPELGHQDCVIKGLLRYFKTEFFTWVNKLECAECGGETDMTHLSRPNLDERIKGANRTEIYRCKTSNTHALTRFPRYDDPQTLLEWRRGRCGEWANCFTLCCMALGSRARWVWNAEDHVWTEVYSERLKRWVHCDSCEQAFDQPQLYAVGWGKKMSYCIAFSREGVQDVTRRYVRKEDQKIPRVRGPEESLKRAIRDINSRCRTAEELDRLRAEDEEEELELSQYVAEPTTTVPEEERPRESGSTSWKEQRGEMGHKK
ncbi:hypothetical protein BX600DRAFT_468883 [Xylariales sp. PMI_506]|nr:hypothetical protein BX600DRAFT_468883 [Xylariales sp. PMI_506]